ncbi:glycosyltransferase, partial [Anaerolineae bacterium CFX9]|nr:glycosyltransferase [Anaerolineae bacterium CFX9]
AVRHGVPNVHMVGWVPSVIPYLEQCAISIIPLQIGAGTKRKLLQSLMIGTPSVSTSIGIEGMHLTHEQEVLVADTPETFVDQINRLLSDEALWSRLAEHGRQHAMAHFSKDVVETRLKMLLGRLNLN